MPKSNISIKQKIGKLLTYCLPYEWSRSLFVYFNIKKKPKIKKEIINFINDIFIYFNCKNSIHCSVQKEELYEQYIHLIEYALKYNLEEIQLDIISFFKIISDDYIDNKIWEEFDPNDKDKKDKLKTIIDRLWNYSYKDDYYDPEEFYKYLEEIKFGYLNKSYLDILLNVGKIPKKYKKRDTEKLRKIFKENENE